MHRIYILLAGLAMATTAGTAQIVTFGAEQGGPVYSFERVPGAEANFFYMEASGGNETIKGAPYTATAVTESTQLLGDGNRIVHKSTASLARDGQGRTRREESIHQMGSVSVDAPKIIIINDTVAHINYVLSPEKQSVQATKPERVKIIGLPDKDSGSVERHIEIQTRTREETNAVTGIALERRKRESTGAEDDNVKRESLGTQVIEGVSCDGRRETRTIPAGSIGNERPIEIVSEVWTSPELHTVVLRKRSDPRSGETVFRLTEIKRGEPDAALFQVPAGYKPIFKRESNGFYKRDSPNL